MSRGETGVTGAAAPSPVVEELKRKAGAASLQFQTVARGNPMNPGFATSRNVKYDNLY